MNVIRNTINVIRTTNKILTVNKLTVLEINRFYGSQQRKKEPHVPKQKEKQDIKFKKTGIQQEVVREKDFYERKIVDPVWIIDEYPTQIYKIEDAIKFHSELAHKTMFDNMEGFLVAKLTVDMKSKKKGKTVENFKGIVSYPNFFQDGLKKEVIAVCQKPEEIEAAKEAGALMAGYKDIIQMFEKGEISDARYDILVCTPEVLPELTLIKKRIHKDRLPSLKTNTVGENIPSLVKYYANGKQFESKSQDEEISVVKANVGTLDMGVSKLTENIRELVLAILDTRKAEDSVKSCILYCPPSIEMFQVDISSYINEYKEKLTKFLSDKKDAIKAKKAAADQ